jgi:hypothetical protein
MKNLSDSSIRQAVHRSLFVCLMSFTVHARCQYSCSVFYCASRRRPACGFILCSIFVTFLTLRINIVMKGSILAVKIDKKLSLHCGKRLHLNKHFLKCCIYILLMIVTNVGSMLVTDSFGLLTFIVE